MKSERLLAFTWALHYYFVSQLTPIHTLLHNNIMIHFNIMSYPHLSPGLADSLFPFSFLTTIMHFSISHQADYMHRHPTLSLVSSH